MSAKKPDPIEEILGPKGLLSLSIEDFEYRPSQIQMARLIRETIQEKTSAIIEAGTGTGKTLGYLIPLILSDKRSVISTGTKNLQEQIFFKDIPILSKTLGKRIDSLLMKGRKNYLCLHRFFQFFSRRNLFFPEMDRIKEKIDDWLKTTTYADRAEIEWLGDDDPLWDNLSSTSDQCLGTDCLHWDECYLNSLRRSALKSGMIIVNHHLFFADMMVKKSGFGEIIPRFQIVVFDEAHKIEEIATSYFGDRLSNNQLLELASDVESLLDDISKPEKKIIRTHLDKIKTGVEGLKEIFSQPEVKGRLSEETLRIINSGPGPLIREGLKALNEKSGFETSQKAQLQSFSHRAGNLKDCLENILTLKAADWLKWYEKLKRSLVLHTSPLEISPTMEEFLYEKVKTIIFTSATLSTDGHFDYFRSRLGLSDDVKQGLFPSHFIFREQALMYIPRDLPMPNDPLFGGKIAERIIELLKISSGRALILFTSYQNLNIVYQVIKNKIPYKVYKQGDAPRSLLLERFKKNTSSVLLATGSFWQGVDVPGEALSALIIDKLPFDSPGDPIVAGRIESIRSRGGNPFMQYQLPSAIISLKQGLGRLIRNSTDQGLIAVMDNRLTNSRYGSFFFKSLPEIPSTHQLNDVQKFFHNPYRIKRSL